MVKSSATPNRVSNFLSQLEKNRALGDGLYTHVSFEPQGKYYFGDSKKKRSYEADLDKVLTLYCNAISTGSVLTIAEKPNDRGPFRVDVDLKLSYKGEIKRYYTTEIVEAIIQIIHEIIEDYVDLTAADDYDEDTGEDYSPYRSILLEKPSARKEETVLKDGFHLHFPYLIVDSWTSTKMHQELIKRMLLANLWKDTPFADQKGLIDDEASIRNTWMMYGSAKSTKATPYLATAFYDENIQLIEPEDFFASEMEGRQNTVWYYLARFMSIRGVAKATPLKKSIRLLKDAEIRTGRKRASQNSLTKRNNVQAQQDITLLEQGGILEMISKNRADEFKEWYRIGQALYTVSLGGQEGLDLWIKFSKRSNKFVEGECDVLWGKMKQNNWHIGWLMKCASLDAPEEYKDWRRSGVDFLIKACLKEPKPTERDVALIFHKLFGDRFICVSNKSTEWYEFREHRWRVLDGGLEIKRVLPNELLGVFVDYNRRLLKQMKNPDASDKLEAEAKKCLAVIHHLKTDTFQNKVIKQCALLCHKPEFNRIKDENKNLWVCENGVLDLKEGVFREGRPEDYCTYSCGLYYREFSPQDEEIKDLEKMFEEVFPNPNIRNYFLDNVCSVMEGGNPQKSFVIGTGSGSNGKSVVYALFRKMCGTEEEGYCISFPGQLFLDGVRESQGAARPELAQVKGKRLAVVNELTKKDKINIRTLKELTGNDEFFARGLYLKGGSVKPMFKLFMHTNEPPEMAGDDEASWERAFFVDFQAKFVLPSKLQKWPVPPTREEQFKLKRFLADQTLMEKINDLNSELPTAFLWMMFKRYKVYKQQPLVTPEEVLASTNEQRLKNDFYDQFKEERLVKEPGATLKLDMAFDTYNEWHRSTHPYTPNKMNKGHFVDELSKKLGKITAKTPRIKFWKGWKLAADEDEEGGDAETEDQAENKKK